MPPRGNRLAGSLRSIDGCQGSFDAYPGEQEGSISSEWGVSDNNRKAKFYRITKSGKKDLVAAEREWQQANDIIARFAALRGESA